jgi:hypothetical protein
LFLYPKTGRQRLRFAAGLFLLGALLPMAFYVYAIGTERMFQRVTTALFNLWITYGLIKCNELARKVAMVLMTLKTAFYLDLLWAYEGEEYIHGARLLLAFTIVRFIVAMWLLGYDQRTMNYFQSNRRVRPRRR